MLPWSRCLLPFLGLLKEEERSDCSDGAHNMLENGANLPCRAARTSLCCQKNRWQRTRGECDHAHSHQTWERAEREDEFAAHVRIWLSKEKLDRCTNKCKTMCLFFWQKDRCCIQCQEKCYWERWSSEQDFPNFPKHFLIVRHIFFTSFFLQEWMLHLRLAFHAHYLRSKLVLSNIQYICAMLYSHKASCITLPNQAKNHASLNLTKQMSTSLKLRSVCNKNFKYRYSTGLETCFLNFGWGLVRVYSKV